MYQITFEDIELSNKLKLQPGRTAFIDECGSFGFDFEKEGTSTYYILCAVIVKNEQINILEESVNFICRNNFGNGEMKSSSIGENHGRRAKILTELLMLDFSLILLVADKKAFYQDSPITNYKETFVKFLHKKLYEVMYAAYPKLKIVEDEYGTSEFQKSYRKYIVEHRPKLNLFNEYDFDFINSINSPIVQIADIIAGSIMKHLLDPKAPDTLKIFNGKIIGVVNFPNEYKLCFAKQNSDSSFDENIYALANHCASHYIESHSNIQDDDTRLRIFFLKHLLFVVHNVNANKFISSGEIISFLSDLSERKISRDYLYRKIIAPLRDSGVIISTCSQGYKIPTCIDDIYIYANQTNGIVAPMLDRVEKCRELVLKQTDGVLDIFDNPALMKYKRYFADF